MKQTFPRQYSEENKSKTFNMTIFAIMYSYFKVQRV